AAQAPQIAERWLPKGGFRHDRHMLMACGDCHQAAKSNASEDVLLPSIETCRNCHTGSAPVMNKVSSTCVNCHGFHRHDFAPMHETQASSGLRSP
ncbi:MAG: cytochrome c3 family protein, partial [Alphaproteobacteria bacterium]|nr:cytochrome c3 family protein [Alphaproteobacteria bacterium]